MFSVWAGPPPTQAAPPQELPRKARRDSVEGEKEWPELSIVSPELPHTNGGVFPLADAGAFRVLDKDQFKREESASIGLCALSRPAEVLGWREHRDQEEIQVLHMVSKILTQDPDRSGSPFESGFQAFEPFDPGRRQRMAAVLLELGTHKNDANLKVLRHRANRWTLGQNVVAGVADWIRQNYDW